MNSTSLLDSQWTFDEQPKVVIWVVFSLLLLSLLLPLSILIIYYCRKRRSHTYRVAYRAPDLSPPHNFDGGTIRLTRHFSLSTLNESTRFNTLPRLSIVRLPNSDTLIEYEEDGREELL